MVNVIGNATAMMPVDAVVMAQLLEEQKTFYDGMSTFLAQRDSQPLSTSVYASAKSSGSFNRKPYKHYKANGNAYRNIANDYKGNNRRSYAANAPSMTKSSVAPPKIVALNAEAKPFVTPSKSSPVLNAEAKSFTPSFNPVPVVNVEAKSFVAPPKAAPVVNAEAKPFVPPTGSSAGYKTLASPDAFMASARKHLQSAAGTPNTTSHVKAETKSMVTSPKISPVADTEAKSFVAAPKAAPAVHTEAKFFVPAARFSASKHGLSSPDAFMASARKRMQSANGTPNTTSGLKSETKSFVAAPKIASIPNTEAKSFVPAARSTGHYAVLASPEAFMASARKHLNQAAGTPNTVSANTETKSVVETVKITSDAGIEAKYVANTIKYTSVVNPVEDTSVANLVKDTSVINPKVSEHAPGTTSGDDKTELKSVVDTTETTSGVNIEAKPTAGTPAARVNTEVTPNAEPVVYTEAVSYPPSAASTHWSVLATNKQFMASVRKCLMERENAAASARNNTVAANTEAKSKVVDTAETTDVSMEAKPTSTPPTTAVVNTEVTPEADPIVWTESSSYHPPTPASTHWAVLVTDKQFMASVRNYRMERENAVASTRNTIVAVANTEVTPNTASGVNPEAKPFVPAGRPSAGSSGLVSNDKFMASARKFMAGGGLALGKYRKSATTSGSSSPAIKPRDDPARVLLFKNVPDWLNIPDVLGFVYGGAVDCIFRSNMAEITVQFCEEAACMAYLEAHPKGIRVQHPTMPDEEVTIIVEKASRGEEVTPALQMKMATGGSRLVRVDGIFDAEKLQALTAHAMEYEVDHIMFHTEKDKMGSAYVFFCGLADGWTFKQRLQEDEAWNEFVALFMADPCKVATAFHDNTIPNRMASAVAV